MISVKHVGDLIQGINDEDVPVRGKLVRMYVCMYLRMYAYYR
jgi:hypothetical protein